MLKVVFVLGCVLCLTLADPMDEKVLAHHVRSLGSDSESHEQFFPNLHIPVNSPYYEVLQRFIALFTKQQATPPPAATTTAAATTSATAASTTATAKAATT